MAGGSIVKCVVSVIDRNQFGFVLTNTSDQGVDAARSWYRVSAV